MELKLQGILRRFGVTDSRPNEKFIKTLKKVAKSHGMTVEEYRDEILFPHGIDRLKKRFEEYFRKRNKLKKT